MALNAPTSGQLLSVDVIEGRDAVPSANHLLASKSMQGCISAWGASNIFLDMEDLKVNETPSPRTLVLLYAADLFFRLRWEIIPALEGGKCVVAVPYVETCLAFGAVAGLPVRWMKEVLRFAPMPSESFHVNHAVSTELGGATSGFVELCSRVLRQDLRPKFAGYFDDLQQRGVSRGV